MNHRLGSVPVFALPLLFGVSPPLAAICTGTATTGFECKPAGTVAVGAVFAASDADARRNVSLALVNELLEEEGEDEGSGDGRGIALFATGLSLDRRVEAGNSPGFDSDTLGGLIGANYWIADLMLGGAIDYSTDEAKIDQGAGTRDTDELGFQLFATYFPKSVKGLYVSGTARYASREVDTSRTFLTAQGGENPGVLNTARGSADGEALGLLGGAGYQWGLRQGTRLGLSGWLSWQDNRLDGYTEGGALVQGTGFVSGNLAFEDDDYATLDGLLTLEVLHPIPMAGWRLIPGVNLTYVHEFESDERDIHAYLVDASFSPEERDIRFRTNAADPDYVRLGLSLTAEFNRGTTLYLAYNGLFGHDWRDEDLIALGLMQTF